VTSRQEPKPPNGPHVQFSDKIELLGARTDENGVTLYWRATVPVNAEYGIFVHLLDSNGMMIGQADGLPFANRYPTGAWRPGQIIEDRRDLAATGVDLGQIHTVAVGVYVL